MKKYFFIKILFIVVSAIFIAISTCVYIKYPFGVVSYKTISIGMQAAEVAGTHTTWAPPYDEVWEESEFFVYSLGDEAMCIRSDCGVGGYFIECLGGWISGYKDIGEVADYGLRDAGVDINKQKIITIADKTGKIVGIYPGASIKNLTYIMRNHKNLVSNDQFTYCSNMLPRLWK